MSSSYDYEYMSELFPEEHNPIDIDERPPSAIANLDLSFLDDEPFFDIEQICHQTVVYKYMNQLVEFANRPGLGQSERRMFVNLLFRNADLVFDPRFIKPRFLTTFFMESLTNNDRAMIFSLSLEYGNFKTD